MNPILRGGEEKLSRLAGQESVPTVVEGKVGVVGMAAVASREGDSVCTLAKSIFSCRRAEVIQVELN